MDKKYLYHAFGLNISSEISASYWLSPIFSDNFSQKADVFIKLAKLDPSLPKEPFFKVFENKILLNIEKVARYFVCNGNTILVEPYYAANIEELQLNLFGSAFCALLQQRMFLTLNGCGVSNKGEGYLFIGNPGIGKSMLAAALFQDNFEVACDDICALKTTESALPQLYPSYPQIMLRKGDVSALQKDADLLHKVWPEDDAKRFFPVRNRWSPNPLPVKHIYILKDWDNSGFGITNLSNTEKLGEIKSYTHRYFFVLGTGLVDHHAKQSQELIRNASVSVVNIPKVKFSPAEMVQFVRQNIMFPAD